MFWTKTNFTVPLPPPLVKKKSGPLQKARRRDPEMDGKSHSSKAPTKNETNPNAEESGSVTKATRKNGTVTCGSCHQKGHNRRGCKEKPYIPAPSSHPQNLVSGRASLNCTNVDSANPVKQISRSDQIRLRGQHSRQKMQVENLRGEGIPRRTNSVASPSSAATPITSNKRSKTMGNKNA